LDGSEQMFATMCALHAAGFEADVSAASLHPVRARLRGVLLAQHGPAVDAVRAFYKQHELADPAATLSPYVWFALVAGPPPGFAPVLRPEEMPPEAVALEGFSEILAHYYNEQNIGALWRSEQPAYEREIEQLHDPVAQVVLLAKAYVRAIEDPADPRTFSVIVEPLVGRKTNLRNYGDHYAIVLSGTGQFPTDQIRHAFLHFLLDPMPLRYIELIGAERPLLDVAARAPRLAPDLRDDFTGFFTECFVRAVEIRLRGLAPSELAATLDENDADGYVLVRPLVRALAGYEKSEPSLKGYFPDLVRAIDTKAELKRLETVRFAPAQAAPEREAEIVRVKRKPPATIPDDPEVLAELTEGERQIAAKQPRRAEHAFLSVLAKYPDQPRARYGLALVALLDGDAQLARQVLGGLVEGERKASGDALVLAWAHVYLGRIDEDNGQTAEALDQYRAALAVEEAPEQALEAAKRDLQKAQRQAGRSKP
jgi:tetratricopeptide (TPR) repeat protein